MSFLDKIKSSLGGGSGKIKREQFERLQQLISISLSDGVISDEESNHISEYFLESNLTTEDYEKICSEAFVSVVQRAIADRRVTDYESQAIERLADQLQMSPQWKAWAKQEMRYYAMFHYIEQGGTLPTQMPVNVILQRGEVCHLSIPARLLEERVVSRQYVGGSQGVSVRIMKGVTYRVGQQRGHIETRSGIVPISNGYFNITNKRLVFSGNNKSVSSALNKLLDLQLYSDALQFSVTNRQKPTIIGFHRKEESELCGLMISRLLNEI